MELLTSISSTASIRDGPAAEAAEPAEAAEARRVVNGEAVRHRISSSTGISLCSIFLVVLGQSCVRSIKMAPLVLYSVIGTVQQLAKICK
ncbi:hypothetical protein D3C71_1764120 [compost metagenome]